jgi:hypothetical protein
MSGVRVLIVVVKRFEKSGEAAILSVSSSGKNGWCV